MGNVSMNPSHVLKALSIKRKLILIMMATSCTTIILMALLVVINQAINSQRAIQQQLITLADALGSRSTGALTFYDPATGTEILNALSLKSDIIYAVIEHANGDVFATFGDKSLSSIPRKPVQTTGLSTHLWTDIFTNKIHVARDIYLESDRIGTIRIVSTLDELHHALINYMFLLAIISVISFAITLPICTHLQKIVSDPILNLHQAMDSVSENKDYSLRVDNSEENELGAVIDGFNRMLEQIQLRDNKLAKYSAHLEKTIETRTLQLTDANKKRILWLETMARFLRHELKNSSVGIKTSLDLIERRSTEKQKVDIYLARARKSMDNMNALLKSAGDASTLEASLYKEEHKPLNFSSTISSQMETYASIYPGISMSIDCSPDILVLGNKNRLNQLLDKLISNAVEHSDPQATINVSVKQCLRDAKLIVKNKGDALPSEKKTMFDLFVSLRTPSRRTNDNFGLGLYIVKLITESHGGQVNAYDLNDETGAVFEVTLPLANLD